MHWRHKGSHLHNNDASLVSRSVHVLCWQCALALSLSVQCAGPGGPARRCGLQGLPPWLHTWRWRTWQCFVWPPTQLGALLWRHMHMGNSTPTVTWMPKFQIDCMFLSPLWLVRGIPILKESEKILPQNVRFTNYIVVWMWVCQNVMYKKIIKKIMDVIKILHLSL